MKKIIILLVILLTSISIFSIGGNVERVNEQLLEYIKAVTVVNNYAYIIDNFNGQLIILDISDKHNVRLKKRLNIDKPTDIKSYNNYIFITSETEGLKIYDISKPLDPKLINEYQLFSNRPFYSVDIVYPYLYIGGDDNSTFFIMNISNIYNIKSIATYTDNNINKVYDIDVEGNYAYLACLDKGLQVIDISKPTTPVKATDFDAGANVYGVFVKGNRAFVAADTQGFYLLNVADASAISVTRHNTTAKTVHDIFFDHNTNEIYVGDWDNGLYIFRLLAGDSLQLISTYKLNHANRLYFDINKNDYLYIANWDMGISLLDVSDMEHPNEIGWYYNPNYMVQMKIENDFLYLVDSGAGLCIYDLSNPTDPWMISQIKGPYYGIDISNDNCYIVGDDGFKIINTLDPYNPQKIAENNTDDNLFSIKIKGNYAYIGTDDGYLYIYGFNDITNIQKVDSYYTGQNKPIYHLTLKGNYLYAIVYNVGIFIFDISNPSHLQYVRTITDSSNEWFNIALRENRAYVSNGGNLIVFDISSPSDWKKINKVSSDSYLISGLAIGDNFLYGLGYYYMELFTFDISTPDTPTLENTYYENLYFGSGYFWDVELYKDYIYVGSQILGQFIYKYKGTGTIYGNIYDFENQPVKDVTVNIYKGSNLYTSVKSDENGKYGAYNLPAGSNYRIVPEKENYSFTPQEATVNNLGDSFEQNFLGTIYAKNLDKLQTYPNPHTANKGDYIIFDNLTKNATIKVYNIMGKLVFSKKVENIKYYWNLKNNSNNYLAAGIYFYLITDDKGNKKVGKLAIIK